MPVCGLLISLSIVQERLNQASAPRNTPQPSTPPPPMRRPPLLCCPPSIKDLIRRSDCLMGAFKSEKGLPRDNSGVSPSWPCWGRGGWTLVSWQSTGPCLFWLILRLWVGKELWGSSSQDWLPQFQIPTSQTLRGTQKEAPTPTGLLEVEQVSESPVATNHKWSSLSQGCWLPWIFILDTFKALKGRCVCMGGGNGGGGETLFVSPCISVCGGEWGLGFSIWGSTEEAATGPHPGRLQNCCVGTVDLFCKLSVFG